jgi:hypothetical protein
MPARDFEALSGEHGGMERTIAEPSGEGWERPRAVSYARPEESPSPLGEMGDPELPYWLAFNRVTGIGPARFKLLLEVFGSAEAA